MQAPCNGLNRQSHTQKTNRAHTQTHIVNKKNRVIDTGVFGSTMYGMYSVVLHKKSKA